MEQKNISGESVGVVFDIQRNSFVDGPGIRTTVFFKGCNLRCAWCHNPESQSGSREMLFYADKCTHCGKCRSVCPNGPETCTLCGRCALYCPADARRVCGDPLSAAEIFATLQKDRAYYENSGGGVTFSGGECMLQPALLLALLKMCREAGIHTAVDTAGNVDFALFEAVRPYTDLFLYDVKCMDSGVHRRYTGVGNERILDNLRRLLQSGASVFVRVPVIGGVNDTVEEMRAIRAFLAECGMPEKVELLPYHAMGAHKYAALGKPAVSFTTPDAEKMGALRAVFA